MPGETPDIKMLAQSRAHAWEWFSLHATQRMQGFNFFLLQSFIEPAAVKFIVTFHE